MIFSIRAAVIKPSLVLFVLALLMNLLFFAWSMFDAFWVCRKTKIRSCNVSDS